MDVKNITMEIFKQQCKLCGDITSNGNFKIIDDAMKDNFSVLLLKLTFSNETQCVVCEACSSKVLAALNFKSTCLYTDNSIIPFIDFENQNPVDLKEVYAKEKGSIHANSMLEDLKICRLCFQPIRGEHWSLQEVPFDSVQIFIPEINLDVTADPQFCSHCIDSLSVHSNFLKRCLDLQQKIEITENGANDTLLINSCIKTEEIEIKSEEMDEPRYTPSPNPHGVIDTKIESGNSLEVPKPYPTTQSVVPNHKDSSDMRMYRCTSCVYQTNHKGSLQLHLLTHKDPSEIQMYKCTSCTYETKYKGVLKVHLLGHKDSSEVQMYKCHNCKYETKHKNLLYTHMLVHKDPSEVQMYKCDSCEFETKRRESLLRHLLTHKDPSQVRMYSCDMCKYKCKNGSNFRRHQLTHKEPSEVRMYKCDVCEFETKYKDGLKVHQLTHKDPSEVQMYECDSCEYKNWNKKNFRSHRLLHMDSSEVQTYKCAECRYETKYRRSLVKHQLTHRDSSEVQMYKCDECKYEAMQKGNLKRHKLIHKTV